jgi:hypothetical protein
MVIETDKGEAGKKMKGIMGKWKETKTMWEGGGEEIN